MPKRKKQNQQQQVPPPQSPLPEPGETGDEDDRSPIGPPSLLGPPPMANGKPGDPKSAPNWKPPTCPSPVEWINKLLYMHAMEYYTAMKMSELLLQATNLDESHKHDVERKKPDTKECRLSSQRSCRIKGTTDSTITESPTSSSWARPWGSSQRRLSQRAKKPSKAQKLVSHQEYLSTQGWTTGSRRLFFLSLEVKVVLNVSSPSIKTTIPKYLEMTNLTAPSADTLPKRATVDMKTSVPSTTQASMDLLCETVPSCPSWNEPSVTWRP